jgi:uncharacterized membrane protein
LLVAITAVAVALRLWGLGAPSLGPDEFNSVFASTGRSFSDAFVPLGIVLERAPAPPTSLEQAAAWPHIWGAANGNPHGNPHPPLHALCLRAWREAFGDTEFSLRLPSVLASAAAVLLIYDTVRTLHTSAAGLWAAALMALAPLQVRWAQQVRGYALGLALALAAAAVFARIVRNGPTPLRLFALGLAALASALTHYFAIAALFALGAYAVLALRGRARRAVLGVLAGAGALFLAAWGPFFFYLHLLPARGFPAFVEGRPGHAMRTVARSLSVPWFNLSGGEVDALAPMPWSGLLFVAALLACRRHRHMRLWVLWAGVTVGLVAVHDLANTTRQLSLARFSFFASPATYAMLAVVASAMSPWLRHGIPAVALTAAALHLPHAFSPHSPPWRELGETVRLFLRDGEMLVISSDGPKVLPPDVLANRVFRSVSHYTDLRGSGLLLIDVPASPTAGQLRCLPSFWALLSRDGQRHRVFEGAAETFSSPGIPVLYRVEWPPSMPREPQCPP